MGPIDNISNLPGNLSRAQRNEDSKKVNQQKNEQVEKNQVKKPDGSKQDHVQVSSTGKFLQENAKSVGDYLKELENAKTLNPADAKYIGEKIDTDFYFNPAVINKVVQSISQELNSQNVKEVHSGLKVERLQEIVNNIRNSHYDSDEITSVIADRLLKDL